MSSFPTGHTDGLVDAWAVGVFAQQVVVAVVFGYHLAAVIEVLCGVAVHVLFDAPAVNIIFVVNLPPGSGIWIGRWWRRWRRTCGARPLDVVHPAAIIFEAADLHIAPFERVNPGGNGIFLLYPVLIGDAVL